ncbi:1-(5-phosphoribosyl)-5-[(5-phosphoribosylamino)methylideneamino] imidazole-4-carboxamide isomerase [Crenobacter luteus]|uniref:1-(5-phosphoribosyl)-5-[(5-phosphoribosylamino)methylideneamino] imidazole-4-carboxamide isomerase n=1 Tax=Crenobacter luteus TaxID=1452487 RepID=A0A165FHN0_9NEIS|nr:1-(5-phosphoribosyl)-5-[(5-phosphoribosylamino)methylideneamino]imidazole-4-carboxamide isomerase [Crenobacter luteus]KZE33304.1 1-(5-phosphoribosyl)-5-((5-phosphoribosylamino)methylideneamino)imidazole-4-carboxamide isomerase [Crenobacter luteus]TCP13604.1 1-(5-phosphoribosyl)-5-[(5-phosphoribosylamino)methylideneamino] imidazole-4-carboxamide isomerase [Crenobacter luteus]
MLLIPAIDLKDGQCVRLKQGVMDDATVFSDDPVKVALHWREQGARRLHLVDLNGAFAGKPKNLPVIRDILAEVGDDMPVQLGGGIRDLDTIEKYLDMGLKHVIIGTAAVKNPGFLHDACDAFPGQVIVGLDAKDGMVAIDGWAKVTNHNVIEMARRFQDYGVVSVIYTDIGRDGMMNGVNIDATVKLAQALTIPVIASGGLSNLDDVRALCAVEDEGIEGAITGRAIYEGSIQFAEAQSLADELSAD